ncbi:prolyl oligopeptidase family serine peptidase [Streptomyces sp. JUS-F4]|uniref:alpha/beta hydrolase family protein n=1 Tax=Streptomyces sp. JUS-F4 TaxID=2951988 RepID=UPI001B356709|nr:alpha/beta fold hydrolase [Streptomyces sp. JUS-F4]WKN16538.1 prolyl oligopeptidase family serine peptidase [Streptomyces sp. JUS-F4]
MNRRPERISFRFSARSRFAACLVATADGALAPGWWDLDGTHPPYAGDPPRYREGAPAETTATQVLPTEDGGLLRLRGAAGSGRHLLLLSRPAPASAAATATGTSLAGPRVPYSAERELRGPSPAGPGLKDPAPPKELAVEARGLRLVPGGPPGTLALAVETTHDGRTRVRRVRATPLRLSDPVILPGRVTALLPLDGTGRRYATDLEGPDGYRPVSLDLRDGTWRALPSPANGRIHRLLLSAPASGLLLTASDPGDGRLRIAHAALGDRTRLSFPDRLNSLDGAVLPLAADPAGERVALRVTRGARARLFLYDVGADRPRPAALPPGAFHPVAGWSTGGLRVVYATPDRPTDLVTVPDTAAHPDPASTAAHPDPASYDAPSSSLGAPSNTPDAEGTSHAATEWFATPSGRFEAVVLGDRRTAPTVVVALHGGPEDHWTLGHDPVLARLSDAGAAVVAPNQRGSTGYGRAHAEAIHGAWGVPDLADIRSLVRTLTEQRPPDAEPPVLLGTSYGGFLALLAVCADPYAWARCAVIAPFLSARGLRERSSPAVRALIDRHGLGEPPDDDLGPRDVERLAHRIRVPLLALHGCDDPVVPVDETRRLRQALARAGGPQRALAPHDCLDIPGAGHHPLQERGGAGLTDRLVSFLTARAPDRRRTLAPPELTVADAAVRHRRSPAVFGHITHDERTPP